MAILNSIAAFIVGLAIVLIMIKFFAAVLGGKSRFNQNNQTKTSEKKPSYRYNNFKSSEAEYWYEFDSGLYDKDLSNEVYTKEEIEEDLRKVSWYKIYHPDDIILITEKEFIELIELTKKYYWLEKDSLQEWIAKQHNNWQEAIQNLNEEYKLNEEKGQYEFKQRKYVMSDILSYTDEDFDLLIDYEEIDFRLKKEKEN